MNTQFNINSVRNCAQISIRKLMKLKFKISSENDDEKSESSSMLLGSKNVKLYGKTFFLSLITLSELSLLYLLHAYVYAIFNVCLKYRMLEH